MKAINIIKLLLVLSILVGFSWLHWWVLPDLGMFRFLPNNAPIRHTGASLAVFTDGHAKYIFELGEVMLGWQIAWMAWPALGILFLPVLALGFIGGEFSQKKFDIKQLSEKIRQKNEAMLLAASNSERDANLKLQDAESIYEKNHSMIIETEAIRKEVCMDRDQLRSMRQAVKNEAQIIEKERRNTVFLEKDLAKARAKIRKLEEKQHRWLGKID